MVLKLMIAGAVFLAIWMIFFRVQKQLGLDDRRRTEQDLTSVKLVRCERCGMYLPQSQPCDCPDRT